MLSMIHLNSALKIASTARTICTTIPLERARVGTRLRKEAIKKERKRQLLMKLASAADGQATQKKVKEKFSIIDYSSLLTELPLDDVYDYTKYKVKEYPLAEAIDLHRQLQLPALYDNPENSLKAHVELDMTTSKKTKFLQPIEGNILYPKPFNYEQRKNICIFVKDEDAAIKAHSLGAAMAVYPKQFMDIRKGILSIRDHDFYLAQMDVLPEMSKLKNILQDKFPNPKRGEVSADYENLIKEYTDSYTYKGVRSDINPALGLIIAKIGHLGMSNEEIEENVRALVLSIEDSKTSLKKNHIISMISLECSPPDTRFFVDIKPYLPELAPVEEKPKKKKKKA